MGQLLTVSSSLSCPHGGTVSASATHARTGADGAWVLRASDTFTIAGCAFNVSGSPHPCARIQWVVTATRNKVAGDFVLTTDSVGMCLAADNAPQGTVLINQTQQRAVGV